MATTVSTLPTELVSKVLQHVGDSKNSGPNLISCLLVSRVWRDITLPILYKDLALYCKRPLDRFLDYHDRWAVSSLTQSITLFVCYSEKLQAEYNWWSGKKSYQYYEQILRFAKDVFPRTTNLESFSLGQHHELRNLSFSRQMISTVLKHLPASCVSLELALGTADKATWDWEDPTHHLCPVLRHVLPQMHHVHIDLSVICDAMLGTWDSDGNFHPISMPHLRSFHIDSVGLGDSNDEKQECPFTHQQNPPVTTWDMLIQGLQHVVDLPETPAAEVTVLGRKPYGEYWEGDKHSTFFRCHIRKADMGTTTWAFPIAWLKAPDHPRRRAWFSHYIRMNDENYVSLRSKGEYYITGGRPWRPLITGPRLPTAFRRDTARIPDEKYDIWTFAEWKERYPGDECTPALVENEDYTKMRLLDAVERKGYEQIPLQEETPVGYVRPINRKMNWHRLWLVHESDPRSKIP
ncbi:hypothetical protein NM208_g167 [Fusarium decemcellulare]|uniref:Uncharacterized protein n=1 Tax=Fusarium decemcellulare TaxID=57161 RepID=A0ACC1T0K5_9HYPO|nr:hypothetical protein NM208_g167 [Fusarium decemcellulare]